MTVDATNLDLPVEIGPRSSIFEKTTPDLRRKLDRAIVDYDPPGYLALFRKYGLAELGVSYQAFYNYARKLRRRAATCEMVRSSLADEQDVVKSLPALLGQFLVDQIMANESAGPNAIYRMTLAYSAALKNVVLVHEKRHVFAPRKPSAAGTLDDLSNDELCALADSTLAAQSELQPPTIDDDPRPPGPSSAVDERPAVPVMEDAPMAPNVKHHPDRRPSASSPDHSPVRIPTSAFTRDRRLPTTDDLPDPDPRREALRQRLRENFNPLADLDST